MGDEEVTALVISNGTYFTKAGIAGDDAPRAVFPSMVGRFRFGGMMVSVAQPEFYVGDDAWSKRGILRINSTIEHGVVTNWDNMEKIWEHIFNNELKVPPEEHPILMDEKIWNPRANREKTIQILFETFNVPAASLMRDAELAVYASGRTSALAASFGEHCFSSVAVYEGHALPYTNFQTDLGGKDLLDEFTKIIEPKFNCQTTSERNLCRDMLEKLCYVSQDFDKDLQQPAEIKDYELPDGQIVHLEHERFRAPEVLFQPSRDQKGLSIIDTICKTVSAAPAPSPFEAPKDSLIETLPAEILEQVAKYMLPTDLKQAMLRNIVLEGGSSMFAGLPERVRKELTARYPNEARLKVIAPPERKYSVWIGGSIVASLPTFEKFCISKEDYDEMGPSLVNRNCY